MKQTKKCHCCSGTGTEFNHVAVGNEMRKLRQSRGLLQKTVADRMGISHAYVCDLEMGKRHWTLDKVERYKKACV